MKQAETAPTRAGRSSRKRDGDDIAALRRRIRELERENGILRAASDFFVRELDPRRTR